MVLTGQSTNTFLTFVWSFCMMSVSTNTITWRVLPSPIQWAKMQPPLSSCKAVTDSKHAFHMNRTPCFWCGKSCFVDCSSTDTIGSFVTGSTSKMSLVSSLKISLNWKPILEWSIIFLLKIANFFWQWLFLKCHFYAVSTTTLATTYQLLALQNAFFARCFTFCGLFRCFF